MALTITSGTTITGGMTLNSFVVDPSAPSVSSDAPFAGIQSYSFDGTQGRLHFNAGNLSVGSDWTIEWFQKETVPNRYPRAFCVDDNLFGVSMENGSGGDPGTFYLWASGGANNIYSVTRMNAWHHFALSTVGGTTTIYQDGVAQGSPLTIGSIDTTGQTLYLGGKANAIPDEYFGGLLTDMRWTVGVGVYTGNFTVPTSALGLTQAGDGMTIQAITSGQVKFLLQPGNNYLA